MSYRVKHLFGARSNYSKVYRLKKNPHRKGIIARVRTMTPKKPNSAIRQVAKVRLTNMFKVTARIPGKGLVPGKYSRVLVRGGRANDLPGVNYCLIRGVYDVVGMIYKKRRRSVYGVRRPEGHSSYIRRCFRPLNL